MKSGRISDIKVAFVSQPFDLVYPPGVDSSVPLQTVHLSQELVRRGFRVTVYAPRKDPAVLKKSVEGVHYEYISERGSGFLNRSLARLFRILPARRIPFHASALSELRYTLEVAARLRAKKAQIIHVHSFTNFIPVMRAFNSRARLVLHMHSEWLCQMDRKIMKRRVSQTDSLLACSTQFAKLVEESFPEAASRIRVLFNGVDTQFFSPAARTSIADGDSLRLLFVGRVSPEKGIHDLLDAFDTIAKAVPAVRLDIVGPDASAPRGYIVDVSDEPNVRSLSTFYDIEERRGITYLNQLKERLSPMLTAKVRFCGGVPRQELLEYYRTADVLVNPSLSEMFGGTVAEAMACGLPIVATRVGGMKDTVQHGETGLLVEPGRPDELARALRRLLTDAHLRSAMGHRARERAVSLVSWDRLGEQLASVYRSLVASGDS